VKIVGVWIDDGRRKKGGRLALLGLSYMGDFSSTARNQRNRMFL